MKSPLKKSIGEVVTDYGTKVMRILKKRLQRSLFDFYGDVKADNLRTREAINAPTTPVDGDGGVIYTKSADGKLYYKSNEVAEVELSSQGTNTTYSVSCVDGDNSDEEKIRLTGSDSSTDDVVLEAGTGLSIARDGDKITFTNTVADTDTVLTSEQVQDIVGAMFSSNTETNITVTYQDADGTIDLVATDTNTQLTTEEVQDIVGAMFTSNTETRISATYEDADGTIDLVVDDMTADTQLTTEQVQDIVGAMFSSNTETRISATYEDSDGTIDLVVDTIPVDLTSDGAGTVHTNNITDLHGAGVDGAANQLLTDDGDGTVTSESGLTYDSSTDTLQLTSTDAGFPRLEIKSNANTTSGQRLTFIKDRGAAPSDNDTLGIIRFEGEDSGQNATFYAQMFASIATAADGSEGGKITFQVASHDGEAVNGLEVFDGDAEDEVDVNIASGASSRTTVAGILTVNGNDITNNSSAANFNISSSRVLQLQHAGSFNIQMGNSTNVGVLKVQGDSQEVTVNGTLKLPDNAIVGKQREIYSQSFLDDLGTTKHYLPFKDINEQTTIYQEEAAMIVPCDGRVVSVTIRTSSITGSGNMTIGVNTIAPNVNQFSTSNWTEEETESLAVASSDDYHVFHFAFDNAKHFDSGDLLTISIQNDADLSGTTYWYVSTVVEYDWSTFLGTTSAEYDSNP